MKGLTTKLMIAAAALVATAGVASAQTMEAKIPFAFRANGKVLAPGTYRVTVGYGSSGILRVNIGSRETGDYALAVGFANEDPKKSWVASGNPVLEFRCGASRCTLHELWMGGAMTPAYSIPTPKSDKDDYRMTAEITMHRVASE